MELKDFITETLLQILDGVKNAQSKPEGHNVNAKIAGQQLGGNITNSGAHGLFTRVDFDVSVSAETKGEAGAKLMVFGVGAKGIAGHSVGTANKITFSIPIRLPEGDTTKDEEFRNSLKKVESKLGDVGKQLA